MPKHLPLILTLLLTTLPTRALIAVKTPVSQMYAGSPTVILAKITTFNPDTNILEATPTTLKGEALGDTLKLKLDNLPTLTKSIKPDQPLVLFLAKRPTNNALHLADTWLTPDPVPGTKSNFVVRAEKDLKQSFPGTTTALAQLAENLKAGKNTMLDAASPDMFKGGTKELEGLKLNGAIAFFPVGKQQIWLASQADLVPVKVTPEAVINGGGAPRIPNPMDDVIAISRWKSAPGDGNVTLILRKNGELTTLSSAPSTGLPPVNFDDPRVPPKREYRRLWNDASTATTAAIGNFGEDDKPYAIVVKGNNILRYPLDASSPPTDFLRLTGEHLTTYHKDKPDWLKTATAQPLDVNGDGRTDLLLNTPAGPFLLINRGHGAFFINPDIGKTIPQLTPTSLWTAADIDNDGHDDLLIINKQTGAVTATLNAKPPDKK